jgi:hypothetical protein
MYRGRIILLLLFTTVSLLVNAQHAGRTETREVWISISETYQQNDTIIAFLSGVQNAGLTNGLLLKAYQASADGIPGIKAPRFFEETGSGEIVFYEGKPQAFIKMYKKEDTLQAYDQIMVRLSVPQLPYRGIFSTLAFYNLIFTGNDKNPLYSLE